MSDDRVVSVIPWCELCGKHAGEVDLRQEGGAFFCKECDLMVLESALELENANIPKIELVRLWWTAREETHAED